MESPRFTPEKDPFFRRARERFLRDLKAEKSHRFADLPLHLKSLFWLTLFGTAYFFCLRGLAPALSGLVAACSSFFLLLSVGHDAVHRCYFRDRRWNYLARTFVFTLVGVNGTLWAERHLSSHHPYPNVSGYDSDIDESLFLRFSPNNSRLWFHSYQHLYAPALYCLATVNAVFLQDWQFFRKSRLSARERILFFFSKAVYVFLWIAAPAYFLGLTPLEAIGWYLLLSFPFSYCFLPIAITHLNDSSHHRRPPESGELGSFALHQLTASLDWNPQGRLSTFFYGGLNSHAAHHLFPSFSHRHYHAITAILREECAAAEVPYNSMSLSGALRSHFAFLREVGRQT